MIKFITRVLFPPIIRVLFAAKIIGRGNMPAKGGVILASNHLSFFDSVIITLLSRRPVSFLAKAEYFTGKGFKGWLSKKFFESIDAIPVNRRSASAAQDALDSGLARLVDGESFAMYPEGTRSLDGRLYRGKTGCCVARTDRQRPGRSGCIDRHRQNSASGHQGYPSRKAAH
jgi:1-acyl-sn-glycerol-3-phosphate acyltransferase